MDVSTAADEVEVISRAYARIHGLTRTDDWILLKFQEEVGELTQAYLEMTGRSRDRGRDAAASFRSEVADVFAQLLVLARRFDVDIAAELEAKWFAFRDVVTDDDRLGIARSGSLPGADDQHSDDDTRPGPRGAGGLVALGEVEPGEVGPRDQPEQSEDGGLRAGGPHAGPPATGGEADTVALADLPPVDEDATGGIDPESHPRVLGTVNGCVVTVHDLAVMPMNFDQVHRFAEPGAPALVPYELRAPVRDVVAACERDYTDYLTEIVERPLVAAGPGERWLRDAGPVPLDELPARAPEAFLEFMDVEAYPLLLHWELWGVLHAGRAPRWLIACVDSCRIVGDELVVCGRCFATDEGRGP